MIGSRKFQAAVKLYRLPGSQHHLRKNVDYTYNVANYALDKMSTVEISVELKVTSAD